MTRLSDKALPELRELAEQQKSSVLIPPNARRALELSVDLMNEVFRRLDGLESENRKLRQEVARLDDTRAAFEDRMAAAILTQQPPNAVAEWLGREKETDNGT